MQMAEDGENPWPIPKIGSRQYCWNNLAAASCFQVTFQPSDSCVLSSSKRMKKTCNSLASLLNYLHV